MAKRMTWEEVAEGLSGEEGLLAPIIQSLPEKAAIVVVVGDQNSGLLHLFSNQSRRAAISLLEDMIERERAAEAEDN